MLLHLLHRTVFVYEGPVHDSFNEARLRPVDDARQSCRRFDLRVSPAPTHVRDYVDYYGNRVHYFDLAAPHQQLVIEAESEVLTHPVSAGAPTPPTHSGAAVPGSYELQAEYLAPTTQVPLESPHWREVDDALAGGRRDAWTEAIAIGEHVQRTFRYQPGSTTVSSTAVDVLTTRCGVCQDFAHVMLGFCRTVGLPARYVSGYFLNETPQPGEVEASHAWVEIYVTGHGWTAYDPTHGRPADERYVQVATGRDYADIRPVSGTYRGPRTRAMQVEVSVRRAAPGPG